MDPLEQYSIPFSGLKPGVYTYDYLIEHAFFKMFELSPVQEGRVWVNLSLTKQETMMLLEFTFNGTLQLMCDRCLEQFDYPIGGIRPLIIKFGEETYEETDEVLILSRAEHKLNIAQYLYEFILLMIPFKVVHPDNEDGTFGCDPVALEAINKFSHTGDSAGPDPRWDMLKKLKKK